MLTEAPRGNRHVILLRVLKTLRHLQRGERVRPRAWAKAQGVSARTVRRDLIALEEVGYPLYETGPGVYRLLK